MNSDTLLHRQVHSSWVQQGRVTSQVFRPTPKDSGRVSVYNGALIDAQGAWEHFTSRLGFASVGSVAVTVAECEQLDLMVEADGTPFPEHASIDFAGHTKNQILKRADRLAVAAATRGWQYQSD